MAQVLALLIAVLLAVAIAQLFKRWLKPLSLRPTTGLWSQRFLVAAMVLLPSLLAVALIFGLRLAFARFKQRHDVIEFGMQLATVLVLVRMGMHALSVSLGPNSWLRAWEMRLTL